MQPIDITVHAGEVALEGALSIPERAEGVVLFAHGSGSSRFSPRNRLVATLLNQGGLGTLLLDLLTAEEHEIDMNRRAAAQLACEHRLEIVPGATHLFEEPGKLEEVARLARMWFRQHLGGAGRGTGAATAARSRLRV
jgi:hypothetical protein